MAERWIINASPLIVLAKVGQTQLLMTLADEVIVPDAVAAEINDGPAGDPARQFLPPAGGMPVVQTPIAPPALLAWDLGRGETAVMAYALANPGWTAVLDDNAARKCARSFGIPVKGTLAVVILAKQRGLIPSASDVLRQLQEQDFRISEHIVREALQRTVNETW